MLQQAHPVIDFKMKMLYRCESSIYAWVHTSLFKPIHIKPGHLIYNRRSGSHIKRQVRDINFTEELRSTRFTALVATWAVRKSLGFYGHLIVRWSLRRPRMSPRV